MSSLKIGIAHRWQWKRDGGFTKRIYVLANRAAELRSSEQRGGGEEGELRMTRTRVARK